MNTFHVNVQFLSYLHVKSWACAQAQIVWHRGITKKSDRKISPQVILFYIIKRELNWPSPYCLAILCLIPQVPGVTVEWPSKKRQTCDLMKCDKCVNIRRAGAAPYARMGAITASLASRGVWWFGRILPAAPASR